MCLIKRKHTFQDYKNCSEAAQFENKIKDTEKLKLTQKDLMSGQKN